MRLSRRAGAVGACVCAVAMMMSMAAPAQAAVTGWRQFFRHHYGAPGNFSGYRAVVAPGKSDAWAFGGTALSGGTAPFGTPVAEHWNGRTWRGSPLPAALAALMLSCSPYHIAADGHGGLWLNALGTTNNQAFVVHRTASGR